MRTWAWPEPYAAGGSAVPAGLSEIESGPEVSGELGTVAVAEGDSHGADEGSDVVSDGAAEHVVAHPFVVAKAVLEEVHPVVRRGGHVERAAHIVFPSDALARFNAHDGQRAAGHLEIVDAIEGNLLCEVFPAFLSADGVDFRHGILRGQVAAVDPRHEREARVERERGVPVYARDVEGLVAVQRDGIVVGQGELAALGGEVGVVGRAHGIFGAELHVAFFVDVARGTSREAVEEGAVVV